MQHVNKHVYMHMYICMCIDIHLCTYMFMLTCIYVGAYALVCLWMCIYVWFKSMCPCLTHDYFVIFTDVVLNQQTYIHTPTRARARVVMVTNTCVTHIAIRFCKQSLRTDIMLSSTMTLVIHRFLIFTSYNHRFSHFSFHTCLNIFQLCNRTTINV